MGIRSDRHDGISLVVVVVGTPGDGSRQRMQLCSMAGRNQRGTADRAARQQEVARASQGGREMWKVFLFPNTSCFCTCSISAAHV
jgi:hypothetical protein